MPRDFREWGLLLVSLVVPHVAGAVGSYFTVRSVSTWYVFLEKPEFAPPEFVFAPVWIVLYTLIGVSLFLVWRESSWRVDVKFGLRWFGAQLFSNALWSFLFFGLQNPLYGLVCIAVLILTSTITMYYFFRVSRLAGALFIPYILWLLFAALLNLTIVILN